MAHVRGGEIQRDILTNNTGYSATAQRIGKPSYLEPNRQSMQKPIEGRVVLPAASTKNNPAALNKGGCSFSEQLVAKSLDNEVCKVHTVLVNPTQE